MTTIIHKLYIENQLDIQLTVNHFDVTVTLFDTENDEIISKYERTIEEYDDYECLLELYANVEGYYVDGEGCSRIPDDIEIKFRSIMRKSYVR
jgi:hypothetical protein